MSEIQRDDQGRFLPGQSMPAGPGRPARAVEQRMLSELANKVNEADNLHTILDKVMTEASKGKEWAIRFLFEYMVGKPIQRTEQRIEIRELLQAWASGDISATNPPENSLPPTNTPPD